MNGDMTTEELKRKVQGDEDLQETIEGGTFTVEGVAKHLFRPILENFGEAELKRAIDEEVYLPEVTLAMAPNLMVFLKKVCSQYTDRVIQEFNLKMFLRWLKKNQKDKFDWFMCGGEEQRKRLKWLKWNLQGYKKFLLND